MQAWDQFLEGIRKKRGKEFLDPWLTGFELTHFDAQNLYLEAKDAFHFNWFEEHLRPLIHLRLRNNNHKIIKVHVGVPENFQKTTPLIKPSSPFPFEMPVLDPTKTFENFVSSESNLVILQLLQEIPSALTGFNPIYLWGPSGTGKTHLLMATCLKLQALGLKVLYVPAGFFTEQVVQAIRSSRMQEFRAFYRTIDILAIDDIDGFGKKTATQEEFFHTFNSLHTAGKTILISSSLPPYDLKEIEPRLISRFEWGISLALETLSSSELMQVVENKLKTSQCYLSESAKDFLYKHFGHSLHKLSRAIDALLLRAHLAQIPPNEKLSLEKTTDFLQDLIEDQQRARLTPEIIIEMVAEGLKIKSKQLLGKSQTKECTLPRQIAMYFLREELGMPFKKIGEIFSRDHSTVMSSIRLIQDRITQKDEEIFELSKGIKAELSGFEKEKASS